jgi:hypothetical protein
VKPVGWRIEAAESGGLTHAWKRIVASGRRLAFGEVVAAWRSDAQFRASWAASLAGIPFDAYCWECPLVTTATASRPFECVFVSSPALAGMRPEPEAFEEHFRDAAAVATFPNLGGDAMLVAPRAGDGSTDFTHLARFAATATPEQADALWRAVGEAMEKRIGPRPVWLSTAGLGIGWLHVRLDDRPKYYRHEAYRRD